MFYYFINLYLVIKYNNKNSIKKVKIKIYIKKTKFYYI